MMITIPEGITYDGQMPLDKMDWWKSGLGGMSNFDHSVDDGFEDALRTGKLCGEHYAWNFCGYVWFDGEQFCEDVHVYGEYQQTIKADTLEELMDRVNEQYGYE